VVGGDEEIALPAAAAVEIYHTWTLIHDDIIDRDDKRRGHLTVHEEFYQRALKEMGYPEEEARHYGLSVGILAGDILQGWSVSLLGNLFHTDAVDPKLVTFLTNDLTGYVQNTLVEGEMLDIQYSKLPIDKLDIDRIIDMLEKKTGALFRFAGLAGAMIGLNVSNPEHPAVRTLSEFAGKCGTAFQLRDDILGIIGEEEVLGKPVGSDLREGKMTILLYHALANANEKERAILMSTAGNASATPAEITQATDLIIKLGGVERAQELAESYVADATLCLEHLPNLQHTELLLEWAQYLIQRNS
jgi:geranylgeranyl diphosphate synthase type I